MKGLLESASYSTKVVGNLEKFQAVKEAIKSDKSSTSRNAEVLVIIGKTEKVKPIETKVKKETPETKVKETDN